MATATTNANVESVVVTAAEVGDDVTHISVWDGDDPTSDEFIIAFSLTNNPSPLVLGETLRFNSGDLVFTFTSTELTDFGEVEALRGIFRAARYIRYHTGAPGTNGTVNDTGIDSTEIPTTALTFAE